MELTNIRQLYDYNRWAGRRTLIVASRLTNDDFLRPWAIAFRRSVIPSVTFWAQNGSGWNAGMDAHRKHCSTPRPFQRCSLESKWETLERDQMQFIKALTPQRPCEEPAYINLRGERYS